MMNTASWALAFTETCGSLHPLYTRDQSMKDDLPWSYGQTEPGLISGLNF